MCIRVFSCVQRGSGMPKINEDKIRELETEDRNPGTPEIADLFLLSDYLKYRQGLRPTTLFKKDPLPEGVSRESFSGGKTRSKVPRLNTDTYNFLRAAFYNHLIKKDTSKGYFNLRALDDHIVPLIIKVYPEEFSDVLTDGNDTPRASEDTGVLVERANPNPVELQRVFKAFEHGAYSIRYARNEGTERSRDEGTPHFAKGVIKVNPPDGRNFLDFTIKYNARPETPIDITGRIYIFSNNLIFVGAEVKDTAAFFMVMSDDFRDNHHGGLVVRRHHVSGQKKYFTSKVMIYRKTPADKGEDESGQFPLNELKELKELKPGDVDKLLNIAQNEGMSVIFKESMSHNQGS